MGARRRLKRRIYEILESGAAGDRASQLINAVLIGLILINLVAVVLETVADLRAAYGDIFYAIEVVSVAFFTLEYCCRIWVADEHPSSRHHGPISTRLIYSAQPAAIIDLLAIVPFFLSILFPALDLRYLRVFRLVRFLKLVRYSPGLRSLMSAIVSERRALLATLVIVLGIVLTAASALYLLERHAQPGVFGSIPQAIWWALTTLTTVGYGDVVPITAAGRVVAGLVMIIGYGLFALPIGIIATAFAREIHQQDFVVTWGMVAKVPLFEKLNATEIAQVMNLLQAQSFDMGAIIARMGDPARSMYFIASGKVEIDLPAGRLELCDGAFFGEIAVLRKSLRSADVVAASDCKLLLLESDDLHRLMARQPEIAREIRLTARQRVGGDNVTPGGDIAAEELNAARKVARDEP